MKRALLDVNLLLALVWPRHECHAAAQKWFAKSGQRAWATNPLTQLGLLRLLTNSAVTQGSVSAATALAVLQGVTAHDGHDFWPFGEGMSSGLTDIAKRVQGHQQWADAALLWQACEHDGVLVTFDSGTRQLAGREFGARVLVLR